MRFRDNLSAMAPRPNIADKFISTPVNLFNTGDSIRCVVQRVDLSSERVFLTFKSSMVTASFGDTNYLSSFLYEKYLSSRVLHLKSKK